MINSLVNGGRKYNKEPACLQQWWEAERGGGSVVCFPNRNGSCRKLIKLYGKYRKDPFIKVM